MIFREHVKMRCTFLVGDMFPEVLAPGGTAGKKVVKADANTEKRMTTWDQPYRLIRYMSDNLFRALVAVAGGRGNSTRPRLSRASSTWASMTTSRAKCTPS